MSQDTIARRLAAERVAWQKSREGTGQPSPSRHTRFSLPLQHTAKMTELLPVSTPVTWAPSEVLTDDIIQEPDFMKTLYMPSIEEEELKNRVVHYNRENVKQRSLLGIADTYPRLKVDLKAGAVYISKNRKHRVGVLSGGGSGHEPCGSGFVGENMLTCWVSGPVFASPTWQQIFSAIVITCSLNAGGALVLYPNFPMDQVNFGIAIEEAKAYGFKVEGVVLADDISLWDKKKRVLKLPAKRRWRGRPRRPLKKAALVPATELPSLLSRPAAAGSVFLYKIGGALSRMGFPLDDLVTSVKEVHERTATMGVCFEAPSLPGHDPLFTVSADEVCLGQSIRGAQGFSHKMDFEETLDFLLNKIVSKMVQFYSVEKRSESYKDDRENLCVIINNLGTMTAMEMYLIAEEVHRVLETCLFFNVLRMYVGTLCTSLDTNGFQISLLNITFREDWVWLLDAETEAGAWPGSRLTYTRKHKLRGKPMAPLPFELPDEVDYKLPADSIYLSTSGGGLMKAALGNICQALLAYELRLDRADSLSGDGDTGYHLGNFARALSAQLHKMPVWRVGRVLLLLSKIADQKMGGAASVIYTRMLHGAAMRSWSWVDIADGMMREAVLLTSAQVGFRSMLDALIPGCVAFKTTWKKTKSPMAALKKALEKASQGCEATRHLPAKVGRAACVHPMAVVGVDPGALAVVIWLTAIWNTVSPGDLKKNTTIDRLLNIGR